MKRCAYCGHDNPDETAVCCECGTAEFIAPCPPSYPPPIYQSLQQKDDDHLKLLAIFHFVVAGLALLGIAFLVLHYLIMSTVFANPELWKSQKNLPPFPKIFSKSSFGSIF